MVSGTIDVDGTIHTAEGLAGDAALQIGMGANDKTYIFCASSWLNLEQGQSDCYHWDLNMALSANTLTLVPAPAVLLMPVTGLLFFRINFLLKKNAG